ncbi:MAG: DNA polymerase IV [Actinomycetota bacterium]|nr:DNA polymerase IV [Actinomycetota bacterium]
MSPTVLHVDVDEFVAAVEVLRRPELTDKPVVVGGRGDPSKRGVVSTANYEARRYGLHSGMPLRTAVRKCPEAVFLPVDREAYERASRDVMEVLRAIADALEVWGLDEAFLEIQGDSDVAARDIQRAVAKRTGLSCSVGIGDNKLRAKIASGLAKPAGVYRLTAREWTEVMGDRRTEELWGIGRKSARKLSELGIDKVHELAAADEELLSRALGPRTGPWLIALGRGDDSSPVSPVPRRARSRSMERTFDEDVEDSAVIGAEVTRMILSLAEHSESSDRPIDGVTVKIRFAPFFTTTRSKRLARPSTDAESIVEAATVALARFELDRPVRLVGVKVDLG